MQKIRTKLFELKLFDWKLFVSLVLLALVPAIIQTIETFVISTNVSTSGIDVIGQIEWFDLIDETIQAFLIIPLYSILNMVLNKDKERFGESVFKTFLIAVFLYTIFSIVVLIYSARLISFMNPAEVDISLINMYLSLSTIAFIIGIVVSFVNVVFVVIGKSKNVYMFLAAKTIVTIISDFLIIPKFGVVGVAVSNISINIILSLVGLLILFLQKHIKVARFKKEDVAIIKNWARVGVFSGVQQFIANIVYALMIVKMVNLVSESGNYWVSNNFIWGWLLIPINALSEVIRKDCKDGYLRLKQSNYYFITLFIVLLWAISIPLWKPFFQHVERLENYQRIFQIVIIAFPFYIPYAFQQIPDNIFVGLGKTKYNFINTCLINFVYYGIWYILYKTDSVTFEMNTIILMFGFGMVASYTVSIIEEKVFLIKEMNRIEPPITIEPND
ncbi:MAG: hypothetical protein IJS93_02340 [Clostridia bacterium]|nr:hypothetical protein [Clostridia bacterium]